MVYCRRAPLGGGGVPDIDVGMLQRRIAGGQGTAGGAGQGQQAAEYQESGLVHQWVNLSGSGLVLARGLRKYSSTKNEK